jgi:hypothetical protein
MCFLEEEEKRKKKSRRKGHVMTFASLERKRKNEGKEIGDVIEM